MITEKKSQAIKAVRGLASNFHRPLSTTANIYRAGLKDAVAVLADAGLISGDLRRLVQAAVRDEVAKAENKAARVKLVSEL